MRSTPSVKTDYRLCRYALKSLKCITPFTRHRYDHNKFSTCPECEWTSRTEWRERNREYLRKYQRQWRKANPEKVKAYAKKWRDAWGPMAWYDDRPTQGGTQ